MMTDSTTGTDKRAFTIILVTVVLDTMGLGIIFPIMPDLLEILGIESVADAALWGGALSASYALMQFLCSPVLGNLSDAYGRRPILLMGLIGMAIDYVVLGFATAIWVLVIGRMVGGIVGGTVSTATAYLADISEPEDRAKNFGLIGAAFGIGFVLGPAFGGLVGEWDPRAPFFLSAVLAGLNFLCGLFFLPESLSPEDRRPFRMKALNPFASLMRAFSFPGLRTPLACMFIISIAHAAYPAIWSYWSKQTLGWTTGTIGLSLAAYGFGAAVVQGAVIRLPIVTRIGPARIVCGSLILAVISMFGFGLTTVGWVVFAIIPIACLSDLFGPVVNGFMANLVPDNEQGALQGVVASIQAVTAVIGPVVMAAVFKMTADREGAVYLPGAAYMLAGLLIALTVIPLWRAMGPAQDVP
jgi:DHA1 family tetracycline resistance protein-like MFS transporter